MITQQDCINKYGLPDSDMERKWLTLWDIPQEINDAIPCFPNKLYCNKDIIAPLEKALRYAIGRNVANQIKTFDGCFNIRFQRGYENKKIWSIHSWACAIDINAAWNRLKQVPTMSPELVKCFTDAGFDWGGNWKRFDGMHFQLTNINQAL